MGDTNRLSISAGSSSGCVIPFDLAARDVGDRGPGQLAAARNVARQIVDRRAVMRFTFILFFTPR